MSTPHVPNITEESMNLLTLVAGSIGIIFLVWAITKLAKFFHIWFMRKVTLSLVGARMLYVGDSITVHVAVTDPQPSEEVVLRKSGGANKQDLQGQKPPHNGQLIFKPVTEPGAYIMEFRSYLGFIPANIQLDVVSHMVRLKAPSIMWRDDVEFLCTHSSRAESTDFFILTAEDDKEWQVKWKHLPQRPLPYAPEDAAEVSQTFSLAQRTPSRFMTGKFIVRYVRRVTADGKEHLQQLAASEVVTIEGPSLDVKLAWPEAKVVGMHNDPVTVHVTTSKTGFPDDTVYLHRGVYEEKMDTSQAVASLHPTGQSCVLDFSGNAAPSTPGQYCILYETGGVVLASTPPFLVHPPIIMMYRQPLYQCMPQVAHQGDTITRENVRDDNVGTISTAPWRSNIKFIALLSANRSKGDELVLCRRMEVPLGPSTAHAHISLDRTNPHIGLAAAAPAPVQEEAKRIIGEAAQHIGEVAFITLDKHAAPRIPGLYSAVYKPVQHPTINVTFDVRLSLRDSRVIVDPAVHCASVAPFVNGVPEECRNQSPAIQGMWTPLGRRLASQPPWFVWGEAFSCVGPFIKHSHPGTVRQPSRRCLTELPNTNDVNELSKFCAANVRNHVSTAGGVSSLSESQYVFEALKVFVASIPPVAGIDCICVVPRGKVATGEGLSIAPAFQGYHPDVYLDISDDYAEKLRVAEMILSGGIVPTLPGEYEFVYCATVDSATYNHIKGHAVPQSEVIFKNKSDTESSYVRLYARATKYKNRVEVGRSKHFVVCPPSLTVLAGMKEVQQRSQGGWLFAARATEGAVVKVPIIRVWIQCAPMSAEQCRGEEIALVKYGQVLGEREGFRKEITFHGGMTYVEFVGPEQLPTQTGRYEAVWIRREPLGQVYDHTPINALAFGAQEVDLAAVQLTSCGSRPVIARSNGVDIVVDGDKVTIPQGPWLPMSAATHQWRVPDGPRPAAWKHYPDPNSALATGQALREEENPTVLPSAAAHIVHQQHQQQHYKHGSAPDIQDTTRHAIYPSAPAMSPSTPSTHASVFSSPAARIATNNTANKWQTAGVGDVPLDFDVMPAPYTPPVAKSAAISTASQQYRAAPDVPVATIHATVNTMTSPPPKEQVLLSPSEPSPHVSSETKPQPRGPALPFNPSMLAASKEKLKGPDPESHEQAKPAAARPGPALPFNPAMLAAEKGKLKPAETETADATKDGAGKAPVRPGPPLLFDAGALAAGKGKLNKAAKQEETAVAKKFEPPGPPKLFDAMALTAGRGKLKAPKPVEKAPAASGFAAMLERRRIPKQEDSDSDSNSDFEA